MNRHGSMNRIYRLVWSAVRNVWIPVAETARGRGKRSTPKLIAAALSLTCAIAQASPSGGQVVAGTGSITQAGAITTITQATQNLSLTWASFNIAPQQTVNFVQPSTSAIAVNRILGTNGTQILGYLHANGQVFLINPNGIVFGPTAEVNVGGLVASTLDLEAGTTGDTKSFSGTGTGSVLNQGTLTATQGGYVVLLGNHVSNEGAISAQLGTVALGAGSAVTVAFGDNSRLRLQVEQSVLNSLAQNGGLIRADGGQVIMTAGARDTLLASAVNNTGVIEARSVDTHDGTITLLGGMTAGTVKVGGTLDASAPDGGNGGMIDTSAAHVEVAGDARVTTAARDGLFGSWLIDPNDYTVAASGGDITGAALSTDLGTTDITLQSSAGGTPGAGNVNVNDAVTWSANTTLTLTASNNVNVNANIAASGATAGLVINPNTANATGGSVETPSGTGTFNLTRASITLSGATPHLSIAGTAYTVINALGAPGSVTGTDLQGMNGNLAASYALGGNIDASATSAWNAGAGFTPIGSQGTAFSGTFDGLGHTVSNLTIKLPLVNYVGLFGSIGAGSVVQNIGLVGGGVIGDEFVGGLAGASAGMVRNSYVTGGVSGTAGIVGGLVGLNDGTVSNSYATGSVSGGNGVGGLVGLSIGGAIYGSLATGSVSGTNNDVGGLAGASTGPISNSSATGSVSGNGPYIGGLVGLNGGPISNSNATGNVNGSTYVGGLVGVNAASASITSSYATGNVSGTGGRIGGLAGMSAGAVSNAYATGSVSGPTDVGGLVGLTYGSTLSNSYSTGTVTGVSNTGGLVGDNQFGTISTSYWNTSANPTLPGVGGGTVTGATGLTTAQMQTATNFAGFVFTVTPGAVGNNWVMVDTDGTLNNAGGASGATFPMLSSEYSTVITNAHQLQLIAMALGASYTLGGNVNAAGTDTRTTLGDVWSTSGGFVPIGSNNAIFNGSFDGLGHTISGLTINLPNTNYVGFFGFTGRGSVVQNVGLIGGSVIGGRDVGALIGDNDQGTVNNSYATGSVSGTETSIGGLVGYNFGSISDSYATGNVSGGTFYVGGLVGTNDSNGTVSNSYATGSVSTSANYVGGLVGFDFDSVVSNSYATGSVSGGVFVGGLIGSNYGSTLSNSYSTGTVSGSNYTAGLVGYNHGTIVTSYWNTSTNPMLAVGVGGGTLTGATGLTTVQMQTATNFFGFAFTTTPGTTGNNWVMVDADGSLNNAGGASGATFPMLSSEYSTVITNAHQLQLIAMALGASYTLSADINAAGTDTSTTLGDVWSTPGGFVPIGNNTANFTGSFDGLGHTISGLVINLPASFNVGLFGYTSASSVLQNVGLLGGSVAGGGNTGELVGNLGGTLNNSYATGDVMGTGGFQIGGLVGLNSTGTIDNSYATGTVTGGYNVGGLVGSSYGAISNSHATGDVTGTGNAVGGLVGNNYGAAISNSYASGNIAGVGYVGGLVGQGGGVITNSYATGSVTGSSYDVGGLVGSQYGSISGSHASGNVTGNTNVGGLVGYNNAGSVITESYATGAVTGSGNGAGNVGGLVGNNYGGTITFSQATGTVTGTAASSVGGLVGLNYGAATLTGGFASGVVAGETNVGGLVGSNSGTINGGIATGNVSSTNVNAGGLVGNDLGGTISFSHATGNVTGSSYVGGLLGFGSGGTISYSYSTGIVMGSNYVGGLVGSASGTISISHANGNVISTGSSVGGLVGIYQSGTISGSAATGSVSGSGLDIGGLVGNNAGGSINDSDATGNVTGMGGTTGGLVGRNGTGLISGGFASGVVQGGTNTGGLVGKNYGEIDASYASGSTTGTNNVGGLVGFNRATIVYSDATNTVNGNFVVGGLVGYNYGGIISNSNASGSVTSASGRVGGLAGNNYGGNAQISNSYATGHVNGSGYGVGGLVGANGNTIINSHATGTVVDAGDAVGGLVGHNYGPVSNSYATGNVSGSGYGVGGLIGFNSSAVSNTYATGSVNGGDYGVGGLVGKNIGQGAISNSYATGGVHGDQFSGGLVGANDGAISNSFATGNVSGTGNNSNGGLAGSNNGTVMNSYATGTVSGSGNLGGLVGGNYGVIVNTYATGRVTGTGNVGGLVGYNGNEIEFSYFNSDIVGTGIGSGANAGADGLTTAGMMTMSNFSFGQWNISDTGGSGSIWRIYEGNTAPLLSSFLTPLTVTASNQTHAYTGGTSVATLIDASYSVSGAATSGHIFNINNPYSGEPNVGTYTPALYSDQLGYDISYVNAELTITPAVLTVTANGASRIYGHTNPTLSGAVTGFVGSDTLANATTGAETYAAAATASSNVGSYAITASGLTADDGNYTFSFAAANATAFSITPATLTVTANGASRIYGQANPGLSGTISGFQGSDTLANATAGSENYTTAATANSNVGSYAVTGSGLTADNGNYTFSFAAANATAFNVTPATLTYTAAAASFTAGQTPSGLSGTLAGFVLGDTELSATTGTLTWTTTAGAGSGPGRYAIDGSGLTATNYVFVDAAANATALTLLTPISPPSGPTAPSAPGAAALLEAQRAVTSIEVNLPSSQTNIQLAMLDVPASVVVTQDVDIDVATEPTDNIVMDKRSVHGAMVPSLRVVRGGVKLPDDRVNLNVR